MKKETKPIIEKNVALKILAVASLTLLVFSLSFYLVFFNRSFYDKNYSKNGAYEKVGVEGVRQTTDGLISYMMSENKEITKPSLQVFSEEEKLHLQDVHGLFRTLKYLTLFAIIITGGIIIRFYYFQNIEDFKKETARILRMASYAIVILIAIILLLSLNFTMLFENFHKIFFPQGNYTFPQTSLLIIMYPESFFKNFLIKIFFHTAVWSLILFFLGTANNIFGKRKIREWG